MVKTRGPKVMWCCPDNHTQRKRADVRGCMCYYCPFSRYHNESGKCPGPVKYARTDKEKP